PGHERQIPILHLIRSESPLTLRAASFLNQQDRSGLRRSYHGSCGWESPHPHNLFPAFQHWPELALPPRNLPLTKQLLQFPELSASQWPKLVAGSPISQKQSVQQFLRVHGITPHLIILL